MKAAAEVLRKETGQENFHLYGESSGALKAGAFAMAEPKRVRRLVLLSFTWTGQGSSTLAKRADAVSSEIAIHTEKNTEDLKSLVTENTNLTEAVKRNTDLLEEIHRHVSALTPEAGEFPADREVPPSR